MGFSYRCLATAILTSCPPSLTGICRLTPLSSAYTPNTHTNSHACELCTLVEQTQEKVLAQLPGLSPSLTYGYAHASSKAGELFPLCSPPALHILPFLSK